MIIKALLLWPGQHECPAAKRVQRKALCPPLDLLAFGLTLVYSLTGSLDC